MAGVLRNPLAATGDCHHCGRECLLLYWHAEGEDYADPEAGGVLMESECTGCGDRVMTMVAWEYYQELLRLPGPEEPD